MRTRDWAFLLTHDCMREAFDKGLGASTWPSKDAASLLRSSKALLESIRPRVRELAIDVRHLPGALTWLERLPKEAKISRLSVSHEKSSTLPTSKLLDLLKTAQENHPIEALEIACRVLVNGRSLGVLQQLVIRLRELRLRKPCELDQDSLALLPAACPNLRVLHLEGVSVRVRADIIDCPPIDLRAVPLTDIYIALVVYHPDLPMTDDPPMSSLLFPATLRTLTLENWIQTGLIDLLAKLPALESLTMRHFTITDDHMVPASPGFPALKHLSLGSSVYKLKSCFVDALPALRSLTLEDSYEYTALSPEALSRLDEIRMAGSPMFFEDFLFYLARFIGPHTVLRGDIYVSASRKKPTKYKFPPNKARAAPYSLDAVKKAALAINPAIDPDKQLLLTPADGHGVVAFLGPDCSFFDLFCSEQERERYGSVREFF